MENSRIYQILGVFLVLTSIILGAIGAHLLKALLTESQLQSFETGVRFQMYIGLGLLILTQVKNVELNKSTLLIITIGTIIFSVSIYLLALQNVFGVNLSFLGPITPLGGLLMILGWTWVLISFIRKK